MDIQDLQIPVKRVVERQGTLDANGGTVDVKTKEQHIAEEWTRARGFEPIYVGQVVAERIVALLDEDEPADHRS